MNDVKKFENRNTMEIVPHGQDPNWVAEKREQDSFMQTIERLASRPDIDPDKIQKFMDMNERILDRNAEQAFNASMTTAQNKIELVVAKSENEQTKSKYANLKTILLKAKPIYTEAGFSLMFYEGETAKENHKRICVDIMHSQGHTKQRYGEFAIQTTGIAGKAMMTQIHGEGSAISYGRRYLTCMIFNIPTGDDDDGNTTGNGEIEYITVDMQTEIYDLIKSTKSDKAKVLKYLKAESVETIPLSEYGKAKIAFDSKVREPGDES